MTVYTDAMMGGFGSQLLAITLHGDIGPELEQGKRVDTVRGGKLTEDFSSYLEASDRDYVALTGLREWQYWLRL
ncbi:MAG: hypothetical protein AAF699_20395 [Pseudomonadota bacterium]